MFPFIVAAARAGAAVVRGVARGGGRAAAPTVRPRPAPGLRPAPVRPPVGPRTAPGRRPRAEPIRRPRPTIPEAKPVAPHETIDRGAADRFGPQGVRPTPVRPAYTDPPDAVPPQRNGWLQAATDATWTMSNVKSLLGEYIPKVTWTGCVEARGFKSTPMRNVLHYCLAVVFGMVKATRLGGNAINVKTYPMENRVSVTFGTKSWIMVDGINFQINSVLEGLKQAGDTGSRLLNDPEAVIAGLKKWAAAPPGGQGGKFAEEAAGIVANVNRRVGPAGIWEMAPSDIFAGVPPLTMVVPGVEPFWSMRDWAGKDKRPMLTRKPAANPELPHTDDLKDMHWPTHFDLQSLVAQAFYDPGVLPPVPDTNVALPQQRLV